MTKNIWIKIYSLTTFMLVSVSPSCSQDTLHVDDIQFQTVLPDSTNRKKENEKVMDIKAFIQDWLVASNAYDTENYLDKWQKDAILDDPSVGKVFKGHSGIRVYFENYFIGYKVQTKLIKLDIISDNEAHIEVEFTGDFPGKKVRGIFDFTFKDRKIAEAKADLIGFLPGIFSITKQSWQWLLRFGWVLALLCVLLFVVFRLKKTT